MEARPGPAMAEHVRQPSVPTPTLRVGVLAPTTSHANWEEFQRYLSEYQEQTHQYIRVKDVLNVALRNKRVLASKTAEKGGPVKLVPTEWQVFQRKYICTFGWSGRKSRAIDGSRVRRTPRGTDCPFRFVVQVVERDGGWCLQVKGGVYHHNHQVYQPTFVPRSAIAGAESSTRAETRARDERQQSESAEDTNDADQERTAPVLASDSEPRRPPPTLVVSDANQPPTLPVSNTNQPPTNPPTLPARAHQQDPPPTVSLSGTPIVPTVILHPAPGISAVVSAPEKYHASWDAFQAYLRQYERDSRQRIITQEVLTCAARNKSIRASKSFQRGGHVNLVPEEWGVFQRIYICKHGYVPRKKDTDGFRRPVATGANSKCPFRFVVQLVKFPESWCLEVKNGVFHHNHAYAGDPDVVVFHAPTPPPTIPSNATAPTPTQVALPAPVPTQPHVELYMAPTPRSHVRSTPPTTVEPPTLRAPNLGKRRRERSATRSEDEVEENDNAAAYTQQVDDDDNSVEADTDVSGGVDRHYQADDSDAAPEGCVGVPAPARLHATWESFFEYLQDYGARTFQLIRVQEVMSCVHRNARIRETKTYQRGYYTELVPEHWHAYQRVYVCTHSWRYRPRGRNQRQRKLRSTRCPFRFVVQVINHNGTWCLEVKKGKYYHNHTVDEETYNGYASSRGIRDPANAAKVEEMVRAGSKRGDIFQFLIAQGENVVARDVENLVYRLRKATRTDE